VVGAEGSRVGSAVGEMVGTVLGSCRNHTQKGRERGSDVQPRCHRKNNTGIGHYVEYFGLLKISTYGSDDGAKSYGLTVRTAVGVVGAEEGCSDGSGVSPTRVGFWEGTLVGACVGARVGGREGRPVGAVVARVGEYVRRV
jgi:hypothetical protein